MAEKKSKNKKVLAASVILAAMIVASSSFAWFTSQDEVVNKLSATNTYAVTVTENFTPPPQWLPGQAVEKQAGAINTGNIDAFVKLTLSNELVLTTYGDPKEITADLTLDDTCVELNEDTEVKSLQAGGWLVYNVDHLETDNRKGTGFKPSKTGLYIFERNDSTELENYAGYYVVVTGEGESQTRVYYALDSITHTEAVGETPESFSATIQTIADPITVTPTLTYDEDNHVVVATHGTGEQQIKININLGEYQKDGADQWTYNNAGVNAQEFYYNKILEAGKETGNLVTSV
ncbi:MAG: BsaA family SipW-dependent biofilm matrix protein, partial [Acutalibacteraceae bacterium]